MTDRSTSARVARIADVERLAHDLGDWNVGTGPLFRRLARAMAGRSVGEVEQKLE